MIPWYPEFNCVPSTATIDTKCGCYIPCFIIASYQFFYLQKCRQVTHCFCNLYLISPFWGISGMIYISSKLVCYFEKEWQGYLFGIWIRIKDKSFIFASFLLRWSTQFASFHYGNRCDVNPLTIVKS